MSVLWIPGQPAPEEPPWPTLGWEIIDRLEAYSVYGPGDLLGEPYRLSEEQKSLILCAYEVYPDDHELAGRRRYKRVIWSLAKGLAKTELGAQVAIAEAHPDFPVRTRTDDLGRPLFDGQGNPCGGPIRFPYIPMLATSEEQADELAYGAVRQILENCDLGRAFDIGLERIQRLSDGGEIKSLASAPNSRDGARTTFQHFDETHRFVLPSVKSAHQTMLNNIPKRMIADAWSLETTTAFGPGEGSTAEAAYEAARKMESGETPVDRTFFFFHRQASDKHDFRSREGRRAAIVEASGPSGKFRDIEAVVNLWDSPGTDRAYYERVWGNRPVQAERKAFDLDVWDLLARPGRVIPEGAKVVLSFDGSRFDDSTSLGVRDIATGHSMQLGLWERPDRAEEWEVPKEEVAAAVAAAFEYFDVWRLYCDPAHWQDTISTWAGLYGSDRVIDWWTNRIKAMVYAVKSFSEALAAGSFTHEGNADVRRHIGNAVKVTTNFRDEHDQQLWYVAKERPDSPFKMDAAMTEILSWEARNDAIAAGVLAEDVEIDGFFV